MSGLMQGWGWRAALLGVVVLGASTSGCSTEAFCFQNCAGAADMTSDTGTGTGGTGGEGGIITDGGGGTWWFPSGDADAGGMCEASNGGVEICDGIDNDCDGIIDNGFDKHQPSYCGTCSNNCYTLLLNADSSTITCEWDGTVGKDGTCKFTKCDTDWYDRDGNPANGCETECHKISDNDWTCDNRDDDCDGLIDEDVDKCHSTTDCGQCGHACVVSHGTPVCLQDAPPSCDKVHCAILKCDDDNLDGSPDWWDSNNSINDGCEYHCSITNGGIEICGDGIDNDCDGKIDGADPDLSGDPNLGKPCYGDPRGACSLPAYQGLTTCQGQTVVCTGPNVLLPGQLAETCNGIDDDCNGVTDDNLTDVGKVCGKSAMFPCQFGRTQCVAGSPACVGAIDPKTETCNNLDDDCNGLVDDNPIDATGACNVPIPPPAGATSPCKAGTRVCAPGGVVQCQGAQGPTAPSDGCLDDSNCDGVLSNQPNVLTDKHHCGGCTIDCQPPSAGHAIVDCQMGACVFTGCEGGWVDLHNNHTCDYPCVFVSSQEVCNNRDDNCNGTVDENPFVPSVVQICGVSPAATAPECTTNATASCVSGNLVCNFPPGVCDKGSCSATPDICDGLDNNCNGVTNENTPDYGKPCASDDGLPPPGDGACRVKGTHVCLDSTHTVCSAKKADCLTLPDKCVEKCDGIDNDCDGLVDEPYTNKGSVSGFFVQPVVTQIDTNLWIYSFEASRPSATTLSSGSGNGYFTSAPSGVPTMDKTPACSVPGKIPWFNVTPGEVTQTCIAMGGRICNVGDWQRACQATASCTYGFNPRGAACTSGYNSNKFCNISPAFDFDGNPANGDQDGLLVTASSVVKTCWADWSNTLNNTVDTNKIFDITGNLREIAFTGTAGQYKLLGGAFNTQAETGASCGFTFYTVDQTYQLYDTGFRCCFTTDPTK